MRFQTQTKSFALNVITFEKLKKNMKVIVAGMAKTGTKSMCAALKELGYSVYDYNENMLLLGKEWMKICAEGGSTEDFRRMYENVDAVTDIPACYYWDEIHKAFPDSKVGKLICSL